MAARWRGAVGAVALALVAVSPGPACAESGAPPPPASAAAVSPDTPPTDLTDLGWLQGRWRGESWDATYSSPEGGVILSFAKDYGPDGQARFFEFERIEARPDGVVLVPSPFGRPSVEFRLTHLDAAARRARFENPAHDFPQVIEYHRAAEDQLVFVLTGVEGGRPVVDRTELTRRP